MPDSKAKSAWERENVLKITLKINRNQTPELFALLEKAESKSGAARELMQKAIKRE
jgi:hypothetical protein|nr:MAG TPA: hypothetical protein [Caudoviricetes sp.]